MPQEPSEVKVWVHHLLISYENPVAICSGKPYSEPSLPAGTMIFLCKACWGDPSSTPDDALAAYLTDCRNIFTETHRDTSTRESKGSH